MSRSRTAPVVLTALALLLIAAPSAGAWSGRSHWRFGGGNSWLFQHDAGLRALPTGDGPELVLLDAGTRTLYVTNDSGTVSVLDAATCNASRASGCDDAGTSVPVGTEPFGMALNDGTLYVTNVADGTMSLIDAARCNARTAVGCAAPVATVAVGAVPIGIAIDPVTDAIYVGRPDHSALTVIDGTTCNRSVTTGCAPKTATSLPGGAWPFVDAATRTLYVPGGEGTTMAVIDVRTCNARVSASCRAPAATVEAGEGPIQGLVDPATRTIYVTNVRTARVAVLDGATCNALDLSGCNQTPATTPVNLEPNSGLALDRATRALYVTGTPTDTLSVIDAARCNARFTRGCDTRWPTIQTGNEPFWVEFDAVTGTLYVVSHVDDALAALDARACNAMRRSSCRDEAPSVFVDDAFSIAIDREVETTYIAHANLHELAMLDSSRCSARRQEHCNPVIAPIPGVSGPFDIALDTGTDTLYATNQDDRTLVLIDPAKCNYRRPSGCAPIKTILLPRANNVDIDPVRHAVYVTATNEGVVSVIDGRRCRVRDLSGCTPTVVPAGSGAHFVAADPLTGTVYVSNLDAATVTVLAGGRPIATIPVGLFPQQLAVDSVLRKLYVANGAFDDPGTVSVIDIRRCSAPDTSGCGRAAPLVSTGRGPRSLAIDPTTHLLYTADLSHSTMTVIDGERERQIETISIGFLPWDVAVDPVAKTVYVTSSGEGTVALIPTR